ECLQDLAPLLRRVRGLGRGVAQAGKQAIEAGPHSGIGEAERPLQLPQIAAAADEQLQELELLGRKITEWAAGEGKLSAERGAAALAAYLGDRERCVTDRALRGRTSHCSSSCSLTRRI